MKDIQARHVSTAAALAALLSAAALAGCTEYNEECARFMEDPEGVAGYVGGTIGIARSDVRLHDSPIGQMMADAYYNAFNSKVDASKLPKVALVNGGSIREDGMCEARSSLEGGQVLRKTLRDILPFDNTVILTKVTHRELKDILEHGVASYSVNVPPGSYPQVSGVMVKVDCSKAAEVMDTAGKKVVEFGNRIQSIRFRVRDCSMPDEESCYGDPIDMESDEMVYMAVDSYLFGGGDNFIFDGEKEEAVSSTFNFEVVANYFSTTYTEENPLPVQAETRVILENCD